MTPPVRNAPVTRLDLELTSSCDHACGHCYNVWNAPKGDAQGGYPRGQLPTSETLAMIDKAVRESGAGHVTITGGEPLLRKDALQLVERVSALVPSVQLITNGSHVTPEVARRLAALGVKSVQLTLLSASRERHDRQKGRACFDDTVRAATELLEAGVPVQGCFVATRANEGELASVLEVFYALGARALSYNRMAPAGGSVRAIDELLPSVEQVEADLAVADRLGRRWGIRISTAMPIPPCLIRAERTPWVKFGFCSVGASAPSFAVDPLGNVRPCNLSADILGNVRTTPFSEIAAHPAIRTFRDAVPPLCRGCRFEASCRGGCKASAFAAFGDLRRPEPFLAAALPPSGRGE